MSEVVGLNPDLIVCSRVAFSSAATRLASRVKNEHNKQLRGCFLTDSQEKMGLTTTHTSTHSHSSATHTHTHPHIQLDSLTITLCLLSRLLYEF